MSNLSLYLLKVFSSKARKVKETKVREQVTTSRKQVRHAEYARTQDLWCKNRSKCLRILDDATDVSFLPKEEMTSYWNTIMTNNEKISPGGDIRWPILEELWTPIIPTKIRKALSVNTTSAGPDELSARLLKRVPIEVLCRVLNIVLWCEKVPQ